MVNDVTSPLNVNVTLFEDVETVFVPASNVTVALLQAFLYVELSQLNVIDFNFAPLTAEILNASLAYTRNVYV